MRLIVAGSRSFTDYDLLQRKLDHLTSKLNKSKLVLIHGAAKGADTLADRWAEERGVRRLVFLPNYTQGKRAPHIRNQEMVEFAAEQNGALIAFWDGKSRGTASILHKARKQNLTIRIVKFKRVKG
jgi:hypothetical protein